MQSRNRKSSRHHERRVHDRSSVPQLIELKAGASRFVAQLIDLSNSGARLLLPAMQAPLDSRNLSIVMLDGTESVGFIRWTADQQLGMEFAIPFLDATELHSFDHMGDDFYRRIVSLQNALRQQRCSDLQRLSQQ